MFILMTTWMNGKSLMKHHCLKKKKFYSNLNMEVITNSDYLHTKRVCKDFEIKNLGEYHDDFILKVMDYFWLIFSKTSEKCV